MIRLSGEQTDGISLEDTKPQYVEDLVPKKSFNPKCISEIVDCCVNKQVKITGLISGVIAKIAVVLAQFTVQINMHSSINLPDSIKEIKDIKKKIKVNQCCLLQDTNMLFIRGFIHKNIDYTTNSKDSSNIGGENIQQLTIDIPFKCTTPITFNGIEPEPFVASNVKEYGLFKKNNKIAMDVNEEDSVLYNDSIEISKVSNEYYNEAPYCELISSKIVDNDCCIKSSNKSNMSEYNEKDECNILKEKSILYITLKILQNRQVAIPPSTIICEYEDK